MICRSGLPQLTRSSPIVQLGLRGTGVRVRVVRRTLLDQLVVRGVMERDDHPVAVSHNWLVPRVDRNGEPPLLEERVWLAPQHVRDPRCAVPGLHVGGAAIRHESLNAVWMTLGARAAVSAQSENPTRCDAGRKPIVHGEG